MTAVLFYGGTLFVLGIFHNVIWWYAAYWGRLTSPGLTVHKRRAVTITWMGGPVLYGAAVALAWVDAGLSIGIFLSPLILLTTLAIFYLAVGLAEG